MFHLLVREPKKFQSVLIYLRASDIVKATIITLLHSKWPKVDRVSIILSAIALILLNAMMVLQFTKRGHY